MAFVLPKKGAGKPGFSDLLVSFIAKIKYGCLNKTTGGGQDDLELAVR